MKLAFGINSGSGKDTSVDYLITKYGGKKYFFASPLYNILFYSQKTLNLPELLVGSYRRQWLSSGKFWSRKFLTSRLR